MNTEILVGRMRLAHQTDNGQTHQTPGAYYWFPDHTKPPSVKGYNLHSFFIEQHFLQRLTNGEVPAYNIAEVPWSKLECPTEGSGHGNLRNGHAGATTSAAGIWVEGRLCARSRHLFVVRM